MPGARAVEVSAQRGHGHKWFSRQPVDRKHHYRGGIDAYLRDLFNTPRMGQGSEPFGDDVEMYGLGNKMSYSDTAFVLEVCGIGASNRAPDAILSEVRAKAQHACDRVWARLQQEQSRVHPRGDRCAPYITDEDAFVFVMKDCGAVVSEVRRAEVTDLLRGTQVQPFVHVPRKDGHVLTHIPFQDIDVNTIREKKKHNINAYVKGYVMRGTPTVNATTREDTPAAPPAHPSLSRLPSTKPPMSPCASQSGMHRSHKATTSLLEDDDACARVVRVIPPRHSSPPSTVQDGDDSCHSSTVLSSLSQDDDRDADNSQWMQHQRDMEICKKATVKKSVVVKKSSSVAVMKLHPSSPRRTREGAMSSKLNGLTVVTGSLSAALAAKRQRRLAPTVIPENRHSRVAVEASAERRRSRSAAIELSSCTFKPHITLRSRELGGDAQSRLLAPTVSRVAKSAEISKRNEDIQKEKEMIGCTFAPNINPYKNFYPASHDVSEEGEHGGFGNVRPVLKPSSHVPPLYVEFVARLRAGVAVRMERPTKFSDTGHLRRTCSAPPMIFGLNYRSNAADTIASITSNVSPATSRNQSPQGRTQSPTQTSSQAVKAAVAAADINRRHYLTSMNNMSIADLTSKPILRLPTDDGNVYDVVFANPN